MNGRTVGPSILQVTVRTLGGAKGSESRAGCDILILDPSESIAWLAEIV